MRVNSQNQHTLFILMLMPSLLSHPQLMCESFFIKHHGWCWHLKKEKRKSTNWRNWMMFWNERKSVPIFNWVYIKSKEPLILIGCGWWCTTVSNVNLCVLYLGNKNCRLCVYIAPTKWNVSAPLCLLLCVREYYDNNNNMKSLSVLYIKSTSRNARRPTHILAKR